MSKNNSEVENNEEDSTKPISSQSTNKVTNTCNEKVIKVEDQPPPGYSQAVAEASSLESGSLSGQQTLFKELFINHVIFVNGSLDAENTGAAPSFIYKFDAPNSGGTGANLSSQSPPPAFENAVPQQPTAAGTNIRPPRFNGYIPARFVHLSEAVFGPCNLSNNPQEGIGTDCSFIIGFLVAFIFNWIGLLAIVCFATTLALRCGAVSGFGLFVIKWIILIQHTSYRTDLQDPIRVGVFLILFSFGSFMFVHGLCSYLSAKRRAGSVSVI